MPGFRYLPTWTRLPGEVHLRSPGKLIPSGQIAACSWAMQLDTSNRSLEKALAGRYNRQSWRVLSWPMGSTPGMPDYQIIGKKCTIKHFAVINDIVAESFNSCGA